MRNIEKGLDLNNRKKLHLKKRNSFQTEMGEKMNERL